MSGAIALIGFIGTGAALSLGTNHSADALWAAGVALATAFAVAGGAWLMIQHARFLYLRTAFCTGAVLVCVVKECLEDSYGRGASILFAVCVYWPCVFRSGALPAKTAATADQVP